MPDQPGPIPAPRPIEGQELLDLRNRSMHGPPLTSEELREVIARLRVSRVSESGQASKPKKGKAGPKILSDADLDAMI